MGRSKKEEKWTKEFKLKMLENKEFWGIKIPKSLMFVDELEEKEQKLLMIIKNYCQNGGSYFGSNKYLAMFLGLSDGRISQMLSYLRKLKLIKSTEIRKKDEYGQFFTERNIELTNLGKIMTSNDFFLVDISLTELVQSLIDLNGDCIEYEYITISILLLDNSRIKHSDEYLNHSVKKKKIKDDLPKKENENNIPKKEIKIHALTKFWNKLSHTRKHKDSSIAIHTKINKYIEQLKSGTFAIDNLINKDFIKKNNIPKEILNKKWNCVEIKKILKDVNNLYIEGYWPYNKDKLAKGLDNIFYNPTTNKSYFLMCAVNPPKQLSQKNEKKVQIKDLKMYNKYIDLIQPNDEQALQFAFNDLYCKAEKIMNEVGEYYSHTSFRNYVGSKKNLSKFFELHLRWLKKQNNLFTGLLKGIPWKDFLDWVYREYSLYLEPNKKQLETIKRNYERFCERKANR